MKKKEAYKKIFQANDLIWEVLENILYEEVRKGKNTEEVIKLIELLEDAVDKTGAARNMLEEA